MTKILLYLSLLLSSGVTAGEGVVSVEDNLVSQQYNFCDQNDYKKFDGDDTKDPVNSNYPVKFNVAESQILIEIVPQLLNAQIERYSIRAPPPSF